MRIDLEPAVPTWRSAEGFRKHAALRDGFVAGLVAAFVGGVPSTVDAVARRSGLLEPTLAAGSLLLPSEDRAGRLVLAALPVHLGLSIGWAVGLAAVLRDRAGILTGTGAGLAIAAFDLGLVGRLFPRVRALRPLPQIVDHLAFGAAVGAVLRRRREAGASRRL